MVGWKQTNISVSVQHLMVADQSTTEDACTRGPVGVGHGIQINRRQPWLVTRKQCMHVCANSCIRTERTAWAGHTATFEGRPGSQPWHTSTQMATGIKFMHIRCRAKPPTSTAR